MAEIYRIAVIGSPDTILGFRALGLETFAASGENDTKQTFRKLAGSDEKYGVIYIEEKLADFLSSEIDAVRDRLYPAVILIPGRDGSRGLGVETLRETVIRAVGADIL